MSKHGLLNELTEYEAMKHIDAASRSNPDSQIKWNLVEDNPRFVMHYLTPTLNDSEGSPEILRVRYKRDDQTYYYYDKPIDVFQAHIQKPLHRKP